MIKTFEAYNEFDPYGEEDWNEEFKIGDKVSSLEDDIYGKTGVIIDNYKNSDGTNYYLVCFDEELFTINSSSIRLYNEYNIPLGHGWWKTSKNIKKI